MTFYCRNMLETIWRCSIRRTWHEKVYTQTVINGLPFYNSFIAGSEPCSHTIEPRDHL